MSKIDINQLTETTKLLDVSVHVIGIKKRCRSVDKHRLDLGKYSLDTSLESLIPEVKALVYEFMRLVQGNRCIVSSLNIEIRLVKHMLITSFGSQDVFNKKQLEVIL